MRNFDDDDRNRGNRFRNDSPREQYDDRDRQPQRNRGFVSQIHQEDFNTFDRNHDRERERWIERNDRADRPDALRNERFREAGTYGRSYDAWERPGNPRYDLPREDDRKWSTRERPSLGGYEDRWGNRGGFGDGSDVDRAFWNDRERAAGQQRSFRDDRPGRPIYEQQPRDFREDRGRGGWDEFDDRGHIYREGRGGMRDRLTNREGNDVPPSSDRWRRGR